MNWKKYIEKRILNEALAVPDCWVATPNKIGSAHGEKKLYLGSKSVMYDYFEEGTMRCVVLKKDLIEYMKIVEGEYNNPKQHYTGKADFKNLYQERLSKVNSLDDELFFEVKFQKQITGRRGYVNSDSDVFQLLREIALPLSSYISIKEFQGVENSHEKLFYWKLFVDYVQLVNPKAKNFQVFKYGNRQSSSRSGQETFRRKVLAEFDGKCIVTGVDEPSLLIASHIRPYSACDRKKTKDHVNPQNGLLLSALYDKLFDKGFITFDYEGNLICSTWLSRDNKERLKVVPHHKAFFALSDERKVYLDFHHMYIFKG